MWPFDYPWVLSCIGNNPLRHLVFGIFGLQDADIHVQCIHCTYIGLYTHADKTYGHRDKHPRRLKIRYLKLSARLSIIQRNVLPVLSLSIPWVVTRLDYRINDLLTVLAFRDTWCRNECFWSWWRHRNLEHDCLLLACKTRLFHNVQFYTNVQFYV